MSDKITIAVSKGRIYDEAMPLLAKLDIVPKDDPNKSRKLVLETNQANIQILIIRATDVPTYVERGAAELGIAGKDVLLEYDGDDLYEPIDLGIAKCRMMLAGLKQPRPITDRPRVATKYINITRNYFAERGQQVEPPTARRVLRLCGDSGRARRSTHGYQALRRGLPARWSGLLQFRAGGSVREHGHPLWRQSWIHDQDDGLCEEVLRRERHDR